MVELIAIVAGALIVGVIAGSVARTEGSDRLRSMSFIERWKVFAVPMWNDYVRPVLIAGALLAGVIGPVGELVGVWPDSSYDSFGNVVGGMVVALCFALLALWKPGYVTPTTTGRRSDPTGGG